MKYYYKTPAEVQKDNSGKFVHEKHPLRNRTFLMVLADVVVVLLIGGILYQSGALDGYLTARGKLSVKFHSFHMQSGKLKLKIHNTGTVRTDFPGDSSENYEALWENLTTERLYKQTSRPQNTRLDPDETAIVTLKAPAGLLQDSEKISGKQEFVVELRFEKQNRQIRFTVPASAGEPDPELQPGKAND